MTMRLDAEHDPGQPVADRELRDEHARSTARPVWYAAIVVLNLLAIVAFLALVVIPRLT